MKLTLLGLGLYFISAGIAMATVNSCVNQPRKVEKQKQVKVVKKNDTLPVGGYLSLVDTPTYTNNRTQRILLDFNELGGGEAVIWGGQSIFGSILDRQITIKEAKTCEYEKDNKLHKCVGIAHCSMVRCAIEVKTGMTPVEYRQVLLHEYMHCMGFDDLQEDKYKNDLMYFEENDASEISIQYYAEQAAERQEIWKSLKSLSSNIKPTK